MSRSIFSVVVCAFSMLLAGCAFDDQGHGRFADQGGSLKDTHLQSSQYHRASKSRAKRRYSSYKKKRNFRHKPVKRIVMRADEAARKFGKKEVEEGADDKSSADTEVVLKAEETVKSQENSDQKNEKTVEVARAEPEKPIVGPLQKQDDEGSLMDSSSDKKSEEKLADSRFNTTETELSEHKEVILPKQSNIRENKDNDGSSALAMHVQAPRDDAPKTRDFKPGIVIEREGKPYSVVKVYYATDRILSGSKSPKKIYGSGRGAISYGSCDVSIPKSHKVGEIEAPSIWRMEFREHQSKHIVLKNVERTKKSTFFNKVENNIRLSRGKNAFVFVHGYNITFHEAAMRTAQIAHDLKFDGVPIFYSWPSRGTYRDYTRDEANIRWTQANLKKFMKDFVQRSKAENIYLIAHSMGARALTGAIAELVKEMPSIKGRIKEVLLAAPDIDAEVFKRDIAPKLVKAARNVTLYASADDHALRMSRTIHGQPRAGDAGNSLVVFRGIDTIDATGVDTSFFGHNYFAEAPSILSDILSIIHSGKRPRDRAGLIPVLAAEGQYWTFRKNNTMIIKGTVAEDDSLDELNH